MLERMPRLMGVRAQIGFVVTGLILVGPLGAPATARAPTVRPRTLVTTGTPIWSFAQDGRGLVWVTNDSGRTCRRRLHFLGGTHIRIGCHLSRDLALAGRTALWKTYLGGGNTELDVAVKAASAGDRQSRTVDTLLEWIDLDSGIPSPYPPVAGAGRLLAFYGENGSTDQSVRRVERGAIPELFAFPRALALATDGRRIAAVRQELGGDGCGCAGAGAWSPDGSEVAFLAGPVNINSVEPADVAVIHADGSGRTLLTHDGLTRMDGGASESGLDWSPDGSRIAYSYLQRAGWTIAVVDSDGTGEHDVAPGHEPRWSPDGSSIAFSGANHDGVFVMNADGSGVRQISANGAGPAWSPDGKRLAFTNAGVLYVVNADGSGVRPLVSSGPYARDSDWSPDGSRIAFAGQIGNGGLWIVNSDGTGLRQVTTESDDFPRWSPNGQRILFTSARDEIAHLERLHLELYTMRSDGTDVRPLTFTQPADWVSVGDVRSLAGRRFSSFAAVGAPALDGHLGPTIGESRALAIGDATLAVLTNPVRTGKAQVSLFDARSGSLRHVVVVPGAFDLGGFSRRRLVIGSAGAIRLLDTTTLKLSTLAKPASTPIGLSVSGRRVAWAENVGLGGRIRAVMLP